MQPTPMRFGQWLSIIVVLVCAVLLALTPELSPNIRLLTNALIMDGTTFPVPSQGFMDSAIDDFIAPAVPDPNGYSAVPVRTPERIIGINRSVDDGVEALVTAMAGQSGPFVVFGYSQSTVIAMRVKAELAERKARGESVPDVTFVGIGVGNRPNGGISQRLAGITIPVFDFTFDGSAPTGSGFTTADIARQYDGLADFPQFPLNPVALANAVLGVVFVHLFYGEEVSLDPTSPKYVPGTVIQHKGDTTYHFVPTADLPLFDPLRLIGVPEQAIDVVEPYFKVLVEAGYDRSVPFGEPTPAQLIPVIDPVTLTIQLAAAVVQGADNAAKIVGARLPGYDALTERLASADVLSANVIGVPYRGMVNTINSVNPFQLFAAVEGPIANTVDSVVNRLGIPAAVNAAVEPGLTGFTGWAERNVLFPRPDAPSNPLASTAIQLLKRVAPHIGTTTPAVAARNSSVATTPRHRAGSARAHVSSMKSRPRSLHRDSKSRRDPARS